MIHIAGCDGGTGASPLALDQERGRAVGARPRRDPAGARRERPARARPRCASTAASRPGRDVVVAALLGADECQLRHRAAARRGLPDGAHLPPRHLPGRDRHPARRAAREVRRHARDGGGLPAVRRARTCGGTSRALGLRDARRGRRPGRAARGSAAPATRAPTRSTSARCSSRRGRGRLPATSAEPVPHDRRRLGARLAERRAPAIREARLVEPRLRDHERATAPSARVSAARSRRRSARRRPPGRVRARFDGLRRPELRRLPHRGRRARLAGEANDYVGKA